jgi:NAD-dependent dihydropyrimidine dehydrogenase PreA subunit
MKIRETGEKRMTEENEKRVRAFYEATVPGHRESLRGLQAPHVIYICRKVCPSDAAILRASRTCSSAFLIVRDDETCTGGVSTSTDRRNTGALSHPEKLAHAPAEETAG